ncbi:hypothetical protein MNEG_3519 [Monoraphidium neglectum]|uniref:Arrestin-like N-terminal domain-containing protein n=1 Tax=Monoraphidium neglectum TaxID=145388 RepID=A0A0D2MP19_9CHLO|nr:hypothetical protein MNEG_3519 [Monoraphidium neglectum]KIZ04440.1 hypothetical protein MNEG_3519 [Monoraphidium neglectum]|eukprot:XP_013903459.1 hypothetical protein MNEG_3519 [Monoraphidium neglectum]
MDGFSTNTMMTDRDDYRVHSYTGDVIKVRLPLVPAGSGTLGLGSYEFPFAVALPQELPGSAAYESGADARCFIEYKVKAVVDQKLPGLESPRANTCAPLAPPSSNCPAL